MKKIFITILQTAVVLVGVGILIFMFWEPHLEGRNVNATLYQIYFNDPFLAYAYIASISFFTVLYQTFKVLGYTKQNKTLSSKILKAVRTIKYNTIIFICFILGAEVYIFTVQRGKDDIAGGVAIGLFLIIISIIIVICARVYEKKLNIHKYEK